jgi:mannose-6-phosphate isomerase-like protein (cupin superfamily)
MYCRSEFSEPFGLALPPMKDCLMFHFVTSGRCLLEVGGGHHHALQSGDLALVPHGEGHSLVSEPGVCRVESYSTCRASR